LAAEKIYVNMVLLFHH